MPSRRGGAVASEAQYPVVILYEHALLGEGIAKYLRARTGVEATVASAGDPMAVTSALALHPAVVIFELSDPLQQIALVALAPKAVLIDISTVITPGAGGSHGAAGLEQILQVIGDIGTVARGAPAHPSERRGNGAVTARSRRGLGTVGARAGGT